MNNISFRAGNNIAKEIVPEFKKVVTEVKPEMRPFPDLCAEQKEVSKVVKNEGHYVTPSELYRLTEQQMTQKANDALAIKAAEKAYPPEPFN